MDAPETIVIAFFAAIGALVVYFIIKRVEEKKKERFEDRDN